MAKDNNFIDGYAQIPAQDFIDFDSAIYDMLHLKLRLFDKLAEFFLNKLLELDGEVKSYFMDDRKNTSIFFDFLKNDCRIHKPLYISKNKSVELRSLSGNELDKMFTKFTTMTLNKQNGLEEYPFTHKNRKYPSLIEEREKISKQEDRKLEIYLGSTDLVWWGFYKLYLKSKNHLEDIDIDDLEEKLKKWGDLYGVIEKTDKLTAYSHIFIYHTVELLRKYKTIYRFQAQGLEFMNNLIQKAYFSSTNQKTYKKNHFTLQLLKKRNRIELYSIGIKLNEIDNEIV